MKKHFKTLFVAVAAIMTIGSVALISCNKEESSNSRTDTAAPEEKNGILSQQFVVAQDTDGSMTVGEELTLLFDKDLFLDAYEDYLQDSLQLNLVAEAVSVTVCELNSTTVAPVLCVSAYDPVNSVTEKVFIVLTRVPLPDVYPLYSFVASLNKTIKCISGPSCERGCEPEQDPLTGELYCTKCKPYPQASCIREITGTTAQMAICKCLANLL